MYTPSWCKILIISLCSALGSTSATPRLSGQTTGQSIMRPIACSFEHYAALGDSYAAGIRSIKDGRLPICNGHNGNDFGPYCTTKFCAKNKGAYSWQFDQTHHPDSYAFQACSGANTDDCSKKQIPQMPNGTDLVTINIGGNNGNSFASVVALCVYVQGKPGCKAALKHATKVVNTITPVLDSLFKQIKAAAPGATVVVLGYVNFWPRLDKPAQCQSPSLQRPTADQKNIMNALVLGMNNALQNAAQDNGFLWVDVNEKFEGHRLCDSGTPWIQWDLAGLPGFDDGDNDGVGDPDLDLFNMGVFHPDSNGQQQYAAAFERAIGCSGSG